MPNAFPRTGNKPFRFTPLDSLSSAHRIRSRLHSPEDSPCFPELEYAYGLITVRTRILTIGYFQHIHVTNRTFPTLNFFDLITYVTSPQQTSRSLVPFRSVHCHIYLNESATIRNTFLMRFYAECDARLPILINTIK